MAPPPQLPYLAQCNWRRMIEACNTIMKTDCNATPQQSVRRSSGAPPTRQKSPRPRPPSEGPAMGRTTQHSRLLPPRLCLFVQIHRAPRRVFQPFLLSLRSSPAKKPQRELHPFRGNTSTRALWSEGGTGGRICAEAGARECAVRGWEFAFPRTGLFTIGCFVQSRLCPRVADTQWYMILISFSRCGD